MYGQQYRSGSGYSGRTGNNFHKRDGNFQKAPFYGSKVPKGSDKPPLSDLLPHIEPMFALRNIPISTVPPAPGKWDEKNDDKVVTCTGISQFVKEFETIKPPLPIKTIYDKKQTPQHKRRERIIKSLKENNEKVEEELKTYDPHSNTQATSDAYATIFVGRLSYNTNEETLRHEFQKYGEIKCIKMVYDTHSNNNGGNSNDIDDDGMENEVKDDGNINADDKNDSGDDKVITDPFLPQPKNELNDKFKGYAFIEFVHRDDAPKAVLTIQENEKSLKIDGRKVVVDVERARTVMGWKPHRLGGTLGGSRESKDGWRSKLWTKIDNLEREKLGLYVPTKKQKKITDHHYGYNNDNREDRRYGHRGGGGGGYGRSRDRERDRDRDRGGYRERNRDRDWNGARGRDRYDDYDDYGHTRDSSYDQGDTRGDRSGRDSYRDRDRDRYSDYGGGYDRSYGGAYDHSSESRSRKRGRDYGDRSRDRYGSASSGSRNYGSSGTGRSDYGRGGGYEEGEA